VRPRLRLLTVAGLTASAAALVASGALATTSKTVTITDAKGDVDGALDIQGVSFKLAADGRLRAAVTVTQKIVPSKLLSETGPPGSVCLKIWTDEQADPTAVRSDRLVCVTAKSKTELRATILDQSAPGLPKNVGSVPVGLNASARSFVLRMSQTSLGRPELIRFAVESTRPGCVRVSCIDDAPANGAVRRFRVR
jgi:hypothetical protein